MGVKIKASDIDRQFEENLKKFNPQTANHISFSLGNPSAKVISAGVVDRPITLYGNKLLKKIKEHGFTKDEIQGLSKAVRNPIAVFKNLSREGAYSILTELKTSDGNFLVAVDLGKGSDADINVVSTVFGKNSSHVVDWINNGKLKYVDKKKALKYLHSAAPIAAASDIKGLNSAANIVEKFNNNNISRKISSFISG